MSQIDSVPSRPVYRILSWVVAICVPVALVLTTVRIMLTPLYIQIEYRVPGFPEDSYGFTQSDRLYWANVARKYLLNSADISYLGDLTFQDGSSLYNPRELGHMLDVKKTVQIALTVWYVILAGLFGLGLWAWFGKWCADYKKGLWRGGWLTVILVGVLIVLVAISFTVIFVAFHNIFFAPGTWTFSYSDTLIRLFPERFWRDIFLTVGLITVGAGLALGLIFRPKRVE